MKNLIYFIFILLFGCASKQSSKCIENLKFKDEFFKNISIVENLTYGTGDGNLRESLNFLSKYVPVSYGKLLNYKFGYDSETFKWDKTTWLKWYEENKCSNIQFK
ncbi:hypothetical protein ACSVH2_01390 [Flavobacterium sp. RSB2_4_14]|uniref:hypothetical protein n=1 Tax=Flavobacterium sp. RSB2_4_14 TaxID=3447665 RepID=UPI003F37A66A